MADVGRAAGILPGGSTQGVVSQEPTRGDDAAQLVRLDYSRGAGEVGYGRQAPNWRLAANIRVNA
jgi:hypothetical protein